MIARHFTYNSSIHKEILDLMQTCHLIHSINDHEEKSDTLENVNKPFNGLCTATRIKKTYIKTLYSKLSSLYSNGV